MINILLNGCNGAMGKAITELVRIHEGVEIVAGINLTPCQRDFATFTNIGDFNGRADVIIDFSNSSAFDSVIEFAYSSKTPAVIATTGLSEAQHARMAEVSRSVPIFFSANMSVAVNLLIRFAKKAASALKDDFDIEIIEAHHNRKLDAPSGTAMAIANAVKSAKADSNFVYERESKREKRRPSDVGIHSVRGGGIVGEHTVVFAGANEVIELKHTAFSRELFADGALSAAIYLVKQKPGLYNVDSMLGENE